MTKHELDAHTGDDEHNHEHEGGCTVRSLPDRLLHNAARVARTLNPTNAPAMMMLPEGVMDPQALTLLTTKYWGPHPRVLTVSFMEPCPAALRSKIVSHMNAWSQTACISFRLVTSGGQVRISLAGSGYWSYLGTDILLIPKNKPTMNLQGFSLSTPDSEYKRVVRHETGHTLGFPHEHMRKELVDRIDKQKAYDYFFQHYGWPPSMVDQNVLTPLPAGSIIGTPADVTSVMCYQLPASIMKPGKPAITGGTDINSTDYAFAGRVYPKPHAAGPSAVYVGPGPYDEDFPLDWDPSEDVDVDELLAD